ncbi:hypothetical protein F4604DRAFT_519505 [Suillus subluteus]|nr:hypothetical protein F4604DRAFT_519505 [Suillus subluteus]
MYGRKINQKILGRRRFSNRQGACTPRPVGSASIVIAIDSDIYKFLISGVVPRPIAFVSTISEDGVENLSPFSWFNTVTNSSPIISSACNYSTPGHLKDTIANSKGSQGFTVNIISEIFVENVNTTAIDTPPDFNE